MVHLTDNSSELSKNHLHSVLKQLDTKMFNLKSCSFYNISFASRTMNQVRLKPLTPKNTRFWRRKSSPLLTTISQICASRKETETLLPLAKKYALRRIPPIFLISFRKNSAKNSPENSFYLKIIPRNRKLAKIHPKRASFLTITSKISSKATKISWFPSLKPAKMLIKWIAKE